MTASKEKPYELNIAYVFNQNKHNLNLHLYQVTDFLWVANSAIFPRDAPVAPSFEFSILDSANKHRNTESLDIFYRSKLNPLKPTDHFGHFNSVFYKNASDRLTFSVLVPDARSTKRTLNRKSSASSYDVKPLRVNIDATVPLIQFLELQKILQQDPAYEKIAKRDKAFRKLQERVLSWHFGTVEHVRRITQRIPTQRSREYLDCMDDARYAEYFVPRSDLEKSLSPPE